jgi:oligosaccharide repeat unit polymerase
VGFSFNLLPNFLLKKTKIFSLSTKGVRVFDANRKFFGFILLLLSLLLYAIMAIKSGGTLWLTDSRYAYQHYREGVGSYYVLTHLFLYLSFILFLFEIKQRAFLNLLVLSLIFLILFYFLGSKRSLLTLILIGITFYSYKIKRLRIVPLSVAFLFIIILFFISQYLYSGYSLIDSFSYFEYFSNMALFLEKNPNFEFMNGKSLASSLWMLVPRELYPDKPFYYGTAYITEFVYPGMAEKGHFIGVLPWAIYYLDFGNVGVGIGGLVTGTLMRYLQLLFQSNTNSFFIFVLFINYGVSNIFKHVPALTLIIVMVIFINFLRLRINAKN